MYYAVINKQGVIDIVTKNRKRAEAIADDDRRSTDVGPGECCEVVGGLEAIRLRTKNSYSIDEIKEMCE